MPGDDPREAVRLVLGELPELPHLPELPTRGPGAEMVGRTAALLVDLPVDLQPSGWRFVDRPGRDVRRAREYLARDLDGLTDAADGLTGPFKVQAAGPWTIAASVDRTRGGRALTDPGAVRDLTASLAEGLAGHVVEVRHRLPHAQVVLQLDEPSLPAVLDGAIPSASGLWTLSALDASVVDTGLRTVLEAVRAAGALTVVHCCGPRVPLDLLAGAAGQAVSLDASLLTRADDEALAAAVESGVGLWLGVVPARDTKLSEVSDSVAGVRALWRRLGFPAERLAATVVPTPACGLAGASPAYARAAMARCREAGRALVEDPEG